MPNQASLAASSTDLIEDVEDSLEEERAARARTMAMLVAALSGDLESTCRRLHVPFKGMITEYALDRLLTPRIATLVFEVTSSYSVEEIKELNLQLNEIFRNREFIAADDEVVFRFNPGIELFDGATLKG